MYEFFLSFYDFRYLKDIFGCENLFNVKALNFILMDIETMGGIDFLLRDAKRVYGFSYQGDNKSQRGAWFREWPNFFKDESYREMAKLIYSYIVEKTSSPSSCRFRLDDDFLLEAREKLFKIPRPKREYPRMKNEEAYN